MNQNAIVVENLSKEYRLGELNRHSMIREVLVDFFKRPFRHESDQRIWALQGVSFSVAEGETVGIIGRNGAGKSTLLKVLSKITYPTSGELRVNGRIASLLEVGTGFHQDLTGRENIYLNGSILGMTKKEINSAIDQIVEFSGVKDFIDTPVKRYSSGMRLRLGFAVAAHLRAEVLLVDEVLAVGDAEFQKKCLNAMDGIGKSGRTVLFVSHNLGAIENLCPRTIWIDKGQVRMDGESKDVVSQYLASFATHFEGGVDLTGVKERGGIGKVRLTRAEFVDADGRTQDYLRCGDKMISRLHFHADEEVQGAHFGLELFTEHGMKVTSFNTWSSGFEIPVLGPGDGQIEVEVDSLNLIPGRYYLSFWIAKVGLFYDQLDHVGFIDVEATDFYGTGRGTDKRFFGIVLFPCQWKLKGQNGTPLIVH